MKSEDFCQCLTPDERCMGTKEMDCVSCGGNKEFCVHNKPPTRNRVITGDLPIGDMVNHPNHYTSGKIEVADAIIDWRLDFLRGNVVKYVARAGKKAQSGMSMKQKEIQDLQKALWYLSKSIEVLKSA